MYVGRDFDSAQDGETRVRGYDLAKTLSSGEAITVVTSKLVLVDGVDEQLDLDQTARFIGGPEFSGTQVFQACSFNDPFNVLAENTYRLGISATTSLGQVIMPWAELELERVFGVPSAPSLPPPANAEIVLLPAPRTKSVLPVTAGYALQDFPTVDQGETRLLGFDVSSALSPSETISGAAFFLTLIGGQDTTLNGNPTTYFNGVPSVSGAVAQQMVAIPTPAQSLTGNIYALSASISTSFNQQIAIWARVNIGVG